MRLKLLDLINGRQPATVFPLRKISLFLHFLSGGLAGLAGVVEVLAIQKKLLEGISSTVVIRQFW